MTKEQQIELTKYSSDFDKFTSAMIEALDQYTNDLENSTTCNEQEKQMIDAFVKGYRDNKQCNIEKIEEHKQEVLNYYKELIKQSQNNETTQAV